MHKKKKKIRSAFPPSSALDRVFTSGRNKEQQGNLYQTAVPQSYDQTGVQMEGNAAYGQTGAQMGMNTVYSQAGTQVGMNMSYGQTSVPMGMNTAYGQTGAQMGMDVAYGQIGVAMGMNTAYGQTGAQMGMNTSYGQAGFGIGSRAEATTSDTGTQSNIEDINWQERFWNGPVPLEDYPFDEPPEAPEVPQDRSAELDEHNSPFWEKQTEKTRPKGTTTFDNETGMSSNSDQTLAPERKQKKRKSGIWFVVGFCLTAVVVFCVLWFVVLRVRNIKVEGNENYSTSEIIRLSGLHIGQSIFVDETLVEQGIESTGRLKFRCMVRNLPSEVVITVRERVACCYLNYCGISYALDRERMVLYTAESSLEQQELENSMVEMAGLKVRPDCVIGQTVVLDNRLQERLMSQFMLEIKVLDCADEIAQIDLSRTVSVLLTTRDGFTVNFGGFDNNSTDTELMEAVHARLHSLLIVRQKLKEMGYSSGNINVSVAESPYFTPPSV